MIEARADANPISVAKEDRIKVLIILYYWPPAGGSGVQRFLKFVKYFRDYGIEPIVFCPEGADYPVEDPHLSKDIPDDLEVIRMRIFEPFAAYKIFTGKGRKGKISMNLSTHSSKPGWREKLALWIRANAFIPDAKIFWVAPSVKFLEQYVKENQVQAIVTTSPPMSLSLIGRNLKRRTGLPWIADFRDPWTDIDWFADLPLMNWAKKKHFALQASVLKEASAVTVIGPTMAALMKSHVKRPIEVITNGYDEQDLQEQVILSDRFTILHMGVLLRNRNHPFLWECLAELVNSNADFAADLDIQLVGQVDFRVPERIKELGLEPYVTFVSHVSHAEAVKRQQSSQVLLLLVDNIPTAKLTLTGKFFEYLMTGRPILCIGPKEGDVDYILQETGAGILVDFGDREALKSAIMSYYAQWKAGTLSVDSKNTEKYSRRFLTGKMAEVIKAQISARQVNSIAL
jgi:glycosyltransferase involved in cell wall biosynthesis